MGVSAMLAGCGGDQLPKGVIFQCDEYTVYGDSVTQGDFVARALSDRHIQTSYRSPLATGSSPRVEFRFSLNSRDNELPLGKSHAATIVPGDTTTCTFGQVLKQAESNAKAGDLPKDSKWTVRVDMRPVLRSFARTGKYVTAAGDTVYADDFKGVWIAGSIEPLTWDFENLHGKDDRKLKPIGNNHLLPSKGKNNKRMAAATSLDDSIYQVTLTVNPTQELRPDREKWEISQARYDSLTAKYPSFHSDQKIVDATFMMTMDELDQNTVKDGEFAGTFRTGAEWQGVWTRDVAYSIIMSLAALDPETSVASLRRKVKDGLIVQDTGTGGAWPVSSDRVCWGIAAWEIYKVTGDKEWLREAHEVLQNTLEVDMKTVYDQRFKLMHGEQSYLDWREQTYPRWMQPADIYSSMCLGTNVVFAEAFEVLGDMDEALGLTFATHKRMARELRQSINDQLWIPQLGRYGQYLYGSYYPILSQSADNLGQALSVLFDVATPEMAQSVVSQTPIVPFGTSSVYPQLPDIQPYHNDAVWPFVQAFWNLAAAKARNEQAMLAGLGAIWRAAAMFATNKELYVASTGDFRGTAVNSDAQLWSCAGNAAMVLRILGGMHYLAAGGIEFHPVIPACMTGDKEIKGLRYRDAVLDITIHGTGDRVASFLIDGVSPGERQIVPATLHGNHRVDITMANNRFQAATINLTKQEWMPATPIVKWKGLNATFENFVPGISYGVYVNGVFVEEIETASYSLVAQSPFDAVAFTPIRGQHYVGFTMRPHDNFKPGAVTKVYADSLGITGTHLIKDAEKAKRFIELTATKNTTLDFRINVPQAGQYFVDVRYANGSGPVNTDSKCAIRTLLVGGVEAGPLVMPQRGVDEWLSTGFSNPLLVTLQQGDNLLSINYVTPQNRNMDGTTNTALIEYVRAIQK